MGLPEPTDDKPNDPEAQLADLQRRFMRGELTAMQFEREKWQIEGTFADDGPIFSGTSDASRAVVPSGLPGTEPIRDTEGEWLIGGQGMPHLPDGARRRLRQLDQQRNRGRIGRLQFRQAKRELADQHGMTVAQMNAAASTPRTSGGHGGWGAGGGAAVGATYGWFGAGAFCLVLIAVAIAKLGLLVGGFVALFIAFLSPVIAILFGLMGAAGGAMYGASEGQHPAVRFTGAAVGVTVAALVLWSWMG